MVKVKYYDPLTLNLVDYHVGEVQAIYIQNVEPEFQCIEDQGLIYKVLTNTDDMSDKLKNAIRVKVLWPVETGFDEALLYHVDNLKLIKDSKPDCKTIW